MRLKSLGIVALSLLGLAPAYATNVLVKMNKTSQTMTMVSKDTNEPVATGEPNGLEYTFDATPGRYILTAYATDKTTVNGTIEVTVAADSVHQQLTILTCTTYVTNKNSDGSQWTIDKGDYDIDLRVSSREGVSQTVTPGKSTTAGRTTFITLNGNSYYLAFIPSEAHQAEGFTTLYRSGTLTAGINISGAIPKGEDYSLTVPKDAYFELNQKFSHFVDFTRIEPKSVSTEGDLKRITYYLAQGQTYNFRSSIPGKLTRGGYFTMTADASKRPDISISASEYEHDPAAINHDAKANSGYETGDIFVNINARGHLELKPGDIYKAHAMRTWELTENSTNNYFIEPDFHYTVIGLDGKPSDNVVRINERQGSAWADIEAIGEGTAIVLVTYDGIGLNWYNNGVKREYMGGEYWGAIWPENTAVYVVTVGNATSAAVPNMFINEDYNTGTLKTAGNKVDAEHDVFYYLDSEEGATYTFKPEGVVETEIAYPVIGERMATYTGFGKEGVTANADGSFSVLLRHGRQIVKMTDSAGKAVYQVLTAKKCHREIVNATREGSQIFQPGDEVKIKYSGLFHPANKLAGIYNMSAYVTYNNIPNGTSLILSANQYTFGSSETAQTVTVRIPADHDAQANPLLVMDEGVIQVNGYGDPIGNHRIIDPNNGRSPNFTAVAHKTYFGHIPDAVINVSPTRTFDIHIECDQPDSEVSVSFGGTVLAPDAENVYHGTYGTYHVVASKPGFRCFRKSYVIGDDDEGTQTFSIALTEAENAWDGKTTAEPAFENDRYVISTPAEMKWFANTVNNGNASANAVLTADIDLGDYDWTPVGTASAKPFSGSFEGRGHRIDGLYVDMPTAQYAGLFGHVKGSAADRPASISGITVDGTVNAKGYAGGIAGIVNAYADIDTCANYASVNVTNEFCGGIAGCVAVNTSSIANCYNAGAIKGAGKCGGIAGSAANAKVENVHNVGTIDFIRASGGCVGNNKLTGLKNAFSTVEGDVTDGQKTVSEEQMKSGEIAFLLGKAFGQTLGEDAYPVFGAPEVKYDPATDTYYNFDLPTSVDELGEETAVPELYFNPEGIASTKPYKGFNIIRMSDGSIRKVFIR